MKSIINNSRDLLNTIIDIEKHLLIIDANIFRLKSAKASISQPIDNQLLTWDSELSMIVNSLWALPDVDGAADEILYTDGAGTLDWIAPGVAAVAGNDTEIQLNVAGAMGTDATFVYNYTDNRLGVLTNAPTTDIQLGDLSSTYQLLLAGDNNETVSSEILFADTNGPDVPYYGGMGIRYNSTDNYLHIDNNQGPNTSLFHIYRNNGDAQFEGNLTVAGATGLTVDNLTTTGTIEIENLASGYLPYDNGTILANTNVFYNSVNGRIGIAEASPDVILHAYTSGEDCEMRVERDGSSYSGLVQANAGGTLQERNSSGTVIVNLRSYGDCYILQNTGIGVDTPSNRLHVEIEDTNNDDVTYALRLDHTVSNSADDDIGVGIEFRVENLYGTIEQLATIEAVNIYATDPDARGELVFKVADDAGHGGIYEVFRITYQGHFDVPDDLTLVCGTDKTLVLSETVYDDVQFDISSGRVPAAANYPTWETFTTNTNEFSFDVDDYIDCKANEPPHGWDEGTTGHLHLHITTKTANSTGADRFAKFTVYFAKGKEGSTWSETSYSAELTIPDGTSALEAFYLDVGNVDLSTYAIGCQLKVRVKRIAATGGTEYADNIFVTQCGLHVEQDTIGSRTEASK